MKLNKVMALALSGLMAVSMLAGCSNGTPNGEENNEGQDQVTVNAAAEVLNKMQDVVDFKSDAKTDGYLNVTLKPEIVESLEDNTSTLTVAQKDWDFYKAVQNKMVYEDQQNLNTAFDFNTISASKKDDIKKTEIVLYAINDDDVLSIEHLMTMLESQLGVDNFKTEAKVGNLTYKVNYNGSVSAKKVTASDDDGTYSVYVVAVSITRTAGDVK